MIISIGSSPEPLEPLPGMVGTNYPDRVAFSTGISNRYTPFNFACRYWMLNSAP